MSGSICALLVSRRQSLGRSLAEALEAYEALDFNVTVVSDINRATGAAGRESPDVVVLAIGTSDVTGLRAARTLARELPDLPLVVVAEKGDDDLALRLVQAGAQDQISGAEVAAGRFAQLLQRAVERFRQARKRQVETSDRAVEAAASGVLDRLPLGVMMLDGRGRVLMTNSKARTIIASADGLLVGLDGVFRAADGAETRALLDLVKNTIAGTVDEEASCALTVSRPSMRLPLNVLVTPLTGHRREAGEGAGAAIFISDPEDRVDIDEDVLRGLYGLSRVEARLALGLAQGMQVDELAVDTKVSIHTVRSQLKQIFRKTSTNRQAELVKLLLTGPAAIRVQAEA